MSEKLKPTINNTIEELQCSKTIIDNLISFKNDYEKDGGKGVTIYTNTRSSQNDFTIHLGSDDTDLFIRRLISSYNEE